MMRHGWGRIVNVTTSLGTMLNAGNPTYGPSKAVPFRGLLGVSR
jgi:3-oxoacyl-[acyl-carrier protein] reductase